MLAPGTRLGPYEILSTAGAGGMGEVYRARDTRLDRIVAVKVLAQNLDARPEVLQRFEREARAVSTLNHPNICTLHDIGSDNGRPYLVMEYLEGETLAGRLARGPLPLADFWRVAIQIGEALDQAHTHGIVHRDLKPGNIMLAGAKGSTTVKLLDFGLAKISEAPAAPGSLTSLPTVVQTLTTEGSIVGTFQYMAPEQLEGKEADPRSDLFAFGAAMHEMITGRKAFQGQSQASLISAIMTADPPPVSTIQPLSPPALDRSIRQCLAKNPDDRWQTARDLVRELRWISESGSQAGAAVTVGRPPRTLHPAWIALGVLTVALLALLAIHLREQPPAEHTVRFPVDPPEKVSFRWYDTAALSPDGTRIVFSAPAGNLLYVRSVDALETRPIPGTEGGRYPFWSPDGRYLAFFAQGKLKKIDLSGGPAIALCDAAIGYGGAWNRDNVILFAPALGLPVMRVSSAGGTVTPASQPVGSSPGASQYWPSFLPDGKHFLFMSQSSQAGNRGVYVGSLDSVETTRLLPDESNAQYSPPGFLIFNRNDTLMARPFDAARLRFTGDPFPVVDHVFAFSGGLSTVPGAAFSTAAGALVYRSGSGTLDTQMSWFDRKGVRLANLGPPADYTNPALSPDGRTLAVSRRDPVTRTRDIWLFDLARGTSTKFTFDPAEDVNPVWSPDGLKIAFSSDRKGHRDIYRKLASGVGEEELVLQSDADKSLEDWTPDGKFLLFNRLIGRREIWAVPLSGDPKPFSLLPGPGATTMGQVSPNGKWIAYSFYESGSQEIFVQNFPPAGGKWQVSTDGGVQPQWRRDGKELFYSVGDRFLSVDVKTDTDRFERGTPKVLFEAPTAVVGRNSFVVTPDGQRFLITTRLQNSTPLPVTVVLNWSAGVKR